MTSLVPNPYNINIELYWPNGTKPNQNEIAVVSAVDVNGATVTNMGSSGWDSSTGGWRAIVLQNLGVFFPPRQQPNLRFEVMSTQGQIIHVTQVFNAILAESTVRIVIGQGDELGGTQSWRAFGTIWWQDSVPVTSGTVRAYDVTAGSTALLGQASLSSVGAYSIAFQTSSFANNGVPHTVPNLQIRVLDAAGAELVRSAVVAGADRSQQVALTVNEGATVGEREVHGQIVNTLGYPVSGATVRATHVAWGTAGFVESVLGVSTTDMAGRYSIKYSVPSGVGEATTPADQVNLLVTVEQPVPGLPAVQLGRTEVVVNAPASAVANVQVDADSAATDSEYDRLHAALAPAFGASESAQITAMKALEDRPEFLAVVLKSTDVSEVLVKAYVRARLLADYVDGLQTWVRSEPNNPSSPSTYEWLREVLSQPIPAEIFYALVRTGRASQADELAGVAPKEFFEAVVAAVSRGLISSDVEDYLDATPGLLGDWAVVVGTLMGSAPSGGESWQAQLLELVFTDAAKRTLVAAAYFQFEGTFEEFCQTGILSVPGVTQAEGSSLWFALDVYSAVDRYLPITKAIFADKVARGWTTVVELSKVALEGGTGTVKGWLEYVAASRSYALNKCPDDVPGKTVAEQNLVYATRLYKTFTTLGAQVAFADRILTAANAGGTAVEREAAAYLASQPDFDLETGNIDTFLAGQGSSLATEVVARIKQLQRVYRLTGDAKAALALIAAGLDSAVAIAQVPADKFVVDHELALGSLTTAQRIHQVASHYAREVFSTIVRYNQALSDTGTGDALPNGVSVAALVSATDCYAPEMIREQHPATGGSTSFPTWVSLFGNLNKCACKDCQTVLSPGAYLVDVLKFLEGTPATALFARRPDLQDIEISCPNTNRLVPYVDLVNEVLEAAVAPLAFVPQDVHESMLDAAAAGDVSAQLAVKQALGRKGFVLGNLAKYKHSTVAGRWVVEDGSWRFTFAGSATTITCQPSPQTSANGDAVDVFPEHTNWAAYQTLGTAKFPLQLPLDLGKEELQLLLTQKRVTRHEVIEAFDVRSPAEDLLRRADVALAFLGLSEAEAAAILPPVPVVAPWTYWGFNSETPAAIRHPDDPLVFLSAGNWVELLAAVPVFLHRSGLTYAQLLDLLDTEFVHREAETHPSTGTVRRLHLAAPEGALEECDYSRYQIAHLNAATLVRISFFIRLWKKLGGWSMRELDRFLMQAERGGIPTSLVRLAQVKRLSDELALKPLDTLALWWDVDTRRTARVEHSLFDEVFLKGELDRPEIAELQRVANGDVGVWFEPDTEKHPTQPELLGHLRAALRVSEDEIVGLWADHVSGDHQFTLQNLSEIYRRVRLARALKLRVLDMKALVALGVTVPYGNPDLPGATVDGVVAMHMAVARVRRVKSTGLSIKALGEALIAPSSEDGLPTTTKERDRLIGVAAGLAKEVLAGLATPNAPDQTGVRDGLAGVMPSAAVTEVLTVLNDPFAAFAGATQSGRLVLERTCGVFLPAAATARDQLFNALESAERQNPPPPPGETKETDERDSSRFFTARAAILWPLLRQHLIATRKARAGLQLATEASKLTSDSVDLLVSTGLSSVAGEAAARVDWESAVGGGWEGHSDPLQGVGPGTWTTNLVIPEDGEFSIVASGSSLTVTQVTLEGYAGVASGAGALAQVAFDLGQLRAGAVVPLRFAYTGASTVSLGWQRSGQALAPLPADATVPLDPSAVNRLAGASQVLESLKVSRDELRYVVARGTTGGQPLFLDQLPVEVGAQPVSPSALLDSLLDLSDLLGLNRRVALSRGTLAELLLSERSEPLTAMVVAACTTWREEDVEALLALWGTSAPSWRDLDFWYNWAACDGVTRRMGLLPKQVIELAISSDSFLVLAAKLRGELRTSYSEEGWREAFKATRDVLRQKQRDALVGYLCGHHDGTSDTTFFTANDLYAHYLIDVEMEPDTKISRIKLALNAVQLFVQRVFLGLEGTTKFSNTDDARRQWEWMRSYRVWEANRKVFLYPENWIEPELRDDKTEIFKELEQELLQDEMTSERGESAVSNYLEKMVEFSDLVVSGAFTEHVGAGPYDSILHVVGRTRSQPRQFFYRTFQGKKFYEGDWTPWRRIPLELKSDVVVPAVVMGRLYLYWLQPRMAQKSIVKQPEGGGEPEGETQPVLQLQLMWSEYVASTKKWSRPKASRELLKDDKVASMEQLEAGEVSPYLGCYHLRVAEIGNELVRVSVVKAQDLAGKLEPTELGTFALRHNGHDTAEITNRKLALGAFWPAGTKLVANGAEETTAEIAGESSNSEFRYPGCVPFFRRTPSTFRVVNPNFGFVSAGEETGPFFYETDTKSFFGINRGARGKTGLTPQKVQLARFSTFNHPIAREFQTLVEGHGLTGIMNRLTQALPKSENYYYNYSQNQSSYYYNYYGHLYLGYHIADDKLAFWNTQRKFEIEFIPGATSVDKEWYPLPTVEFAYGTPFGAYNWELFFHAPMLVAERLTQELRFEEAMNWYHFIFDPRQQFNKYERTKRWVSALPPGCRYWNFLPLFANKHAEDTLLDTLGLTDKLTPYERSQLAALIDEWRRRPFNPHLIARQRPAAYQKYVVMKYLDNLMAWADQLFRQDTFESINQATQLYILADELLGGRPETVESLAEETRLTYRELRAAGLDRFSNAVVDLEYLMVGGATTNVKGGDVPGTGDGTNDPIQMLAVSSFFFKIPRNARLDAYWDAVKDRLFKIRNSMNIDGIKRELALFEPPIDPALLVQAAANNVDLSSVLSMLNASLPAYRFNVWAQKATELAGEVKAFGGALLSALEKRDGESLQLLRQRHEREMQELIRTVREAQVAEAQANIDALDASRATAVERLNEYANKERLNSGEKQQLSQTEKALDYEMTQSGLRALVTVGAAVPDISAGFVGPAPKGESHFKVGTAITTIAGITADLAGIMATYYRGQSSLVATRTGFDRRWEDWDFQRRLAQKEIDQIDQQKVAAEIRLAIAEKELSNHEVQQRQSEEVWEFLQEKFTNEELYRWMVSSLTQLHRQAFLLAMDVARTAEASYRFELGDARAQFIGSGVQWEPAKKGLLAGEQLGLAIKRMEVSYLRENRRDYELTKPISLATICPEALQDLREKGFCTFDVPEVLFDLDHPGQYFRRIKAARISIPCVTGPNTNVSAKLSLVRSSIRVKPQAEGYPRDPASLSDERFVDDVTGIQSIATSTGQNDSGVFELNFRDERYLPFEGAGAISRWRLELPSKVRQFDYHTISDVVLTLSYTARDAGGLLKEAAEKSIADGLNTIRQWFTASGTGLARAFSLRSEFPDQLHQLLSGDPATLTITPNHFPYLFQGTGMSLNLAASGANSWSGVAVHAVLRPGVASIPASEITIGIGGPAGPSATFVSGSPDSRAAVADVHVDVPVEPFFNSNREEAWSIAANGLSAEVIEDLVVVVRYGVAAK